MRDIDKKTIVTFYDAKTLANIVRIVRRMRMGKVRRHGQKGYRTYEIAPRNAAEMPYATRKFMKDAHL